MRLKSSLVAVLFVITVVQLAACKSARFGIAGNKEGLTGNGVNGPGGDDATGTGGNGSGTGTGSGGGNSGGSGSGGDGNGNGGDGGSGGGTGGGGTGGGGTGGGGTGGGGTGGGGTGGSGDGKGGDGSLSGVTDTKTLTPTNNKINLTYYPVVGTIEVYADNVKMTSNWSYQISGNYIQITASSIPAAGKSYSVKYTKSN